MSKYVNLYIFTAPHTFNMYSNFTEVGVTGYCSSAAVDDSVDSVILRGGQNTLIVNSLEIQLWCKEWASVQVDQTEKISLSGSILCPQEYSVHQPQLWQYS